MSLPHQSWKRHTVGAEMRRALLAGLPLMGAQLLSIGNGLIDALVAGQLGPAQLGAVGIGAGIVFIVTLSSIGLLAGLSPTMAQARGRGRRLDVGIAFRQGLWLALVLVVIDMAVLTLCLATLPQWGFDEVLMQPMRRYLATVIWSMPGAVLVLTARNLCEATARARPVLLVQFVGLVVNLLADLGLGLGMFGLPRLGIAGIGWSTAIVQSTTCLILLLFLRAPTFARFAPYCRLEPPDLSYLIGLLKLSAPICLMLLCESGLFVATAIQMGQIGTVAAGAHNIAIGTASATYMLPLGLSFALTARMGVAYGRGSIGGLRLRAVSGLLLTLCIACLTSILLIVFRDSIAALYTSDPEVRALAAALLILGAIFQLSDGLQATLIGLLRGLNDTRVPMLINAFAYWGIGFGTGYFSAHQFGLGAYGLWFGLIAGLSVAALLQGLRLRNRIIHLERAQRAAVAADGLSLAR